MSELPLPLIKVVGISASGKSTLVAILRQAGYNARPVSQEHSYIPDLWDQFEHPFVLISLNVDIDAQRRRRPDVTWEHSAHHQERARLANAADHADLQVDTSQIPAEEVSKIVLTFLSRIKVRHQTEPLPPLSSTGSARR